MSVYKRCSIPPRRAYRESSAPSGFVSPKDTSEAASRLKRSLLERLHTKPLLDEQFLRDVIRCNDLCPALFTADQLILISGRRQTLKQYLSECIDRERDPTQRARLFDMSSEIALSYIKDPGTRAMLLLHKIQSYLDSSSPEISLRLVLDIYECNNIYPGSINPVEDFIIDHQKQSLLTYAFQKFFEEKDLVLKEDLRTLCHDLLDLVLLLIPYR